MPSRRNNEMRVAKAEAARESVHRVKRHPVRQTLGRALTVVGVVAMLLGIAVIVPDFMNEGRYRRLSDTSVSAIDPDDTSQTSSYDWDALKRQNSDTFGWVTLANTTIDYPVVQSNEREYIHKSFWGDYSAAGTPFADPRCSATGRNVVIYGHHMGSSGIMFSDIFDGYNQDKFDTFGDLTWSYPGHDGETLKPVACINVYETFAPIQQFRFNPTDEQIDEEYAKMEAHGSFKTQDAPNADALTEARRAEAADAVVTKMWREWLKHMLSDDGIKGIAVNPDYKKLIDSSTHDVSLVCCSSLRGGQPWRAILICVA